MKNYLRVKVKVFLLGIALMLDAGCQAMGLIITSHPSAALVYINENLVGTTPLLLPLDPGVYTISLRKEGYIDHVEQIFYRGGEERIHFRLRVLGTPDYRIFICADILGLPTAYVYRKGRVGVSFGTRLLELWVGLPLEMTMLRLFNVGLGIRQQLLRRVSIDFALDYKKKSIDMLIAASLPNLKYAFHTFAGISNKKIDYGISNEYALSDTIKLLSGYRYRNHGWSVGVDFALSKYIHTEIAIDKNLKIYAQICYKNM